MAAAHILKREGFEHTTTNRIAEKAGVSVGSLYQYFPNKEAIVAALRERHNDWYDECVRAEFERNRGLSLREGVRRAVERIVAVHALDPALHGALTGASRLMVARRHRRASPHCANSSWTTPGSSVCADPELTCFILVRAVEAVIHETTLEAPQRLRDPNFVDEVTELFVRYVDRS